MTNSHRSPENDDEPSPAVKRAVAHFWQKATEYDHEKLQGVYNDFYSLQDQTETIPLSQALDAMDLALQIIDRLLDPAQAWQVTDDLVDRALTENVDQIQGFTYHDHHSIRDFRQDSKGPEIWRCPRSMGSPNHGVFQKRLAHEKLKAQLIAALSSTEGK